MALPNAPVAETLNPNPQGDDTERIQTAIDSVSKLDMRPEDGIRGAVLLTKGTYRCGHVVRRRG